MPKMGLEASKATKNFKTRGMMVENRHNFGNDFEIHQSLNRAMNQSR